MNEVIAPLNERREKFKNILTISGGISMTCKGCSATVRHSKEEVQALVEGQLMFEVNVVSDQVYSERLAICASCPHLQYETTCGFCGCFVAFRAKLSNKRCPDPKGARWDK